eukprot:COSAG06_NODE_3192_length_5705_cov_4.042212_4_plen_101_part_00
MRPKAAAGSRQQQLAADRAPPTINSMLTDHSDFEKSSPSQDITICGVLHSCSSITLLERAVAIPRSIGVSSRSGVRQCIKQQEIGLPVLYRNEIHSLRVR